MNIPRTITEVQRPATTGLCLNAMALCASNAAKPALVAARRFPALLALTAFAAASAGQSVEESDESTLETGDSVTAAAEAPPLEQVEQRIVELTNQFRRENGLSPLTRDGQLAAAAGDFAAYMARTDRYGHHADGRRPSQRAAAHGYEHCIVAENIAYQYRSTGFTAQELANGLFKGWKNSPEHRRNMLDPDVTQTGVGVARSDRTAHYYGVHLFGRPREARIEFSLQNRTGRTVEYALGKQRYRLEPRYILRHTTCRPSTVVFPGLPAADAKPTASQPAAETQGADSAGAQDAGSANLSFRPDSGASYALVKRPSGLIAVERRD